MSYGAENRGGTKNWPVGSLSATQLSPGQECGGPSQKQKGLRALTSGDSGGKPALSLTTSQKGRRVWGARRIPSDWEAVEHGSQAA